MSKLLRWVNILLVIATIVVYISSFVSPRTFWPLVFPGLLFPWLLAANILFVLYWTVRRNRYVFFSLGVLFMGYSHVQSILGWPFGKKISPNNNSLTVVTFNMHRQVAYPGTGEIRSPEAVADLLGAYQPDVVCLQEVPSRAKDQQALAQAFAKKSNLHFASMSASKSLGIISKYPIKDTKYEYFTNNANGVLWGTIETPQGDLMVYSFHLLSNQISDLAEQVTHDPTSSGSKTVRTLRSMLAGYKNAAVVRSDQADRVNELVKAQKLPFLLCGDLNDVPQSYTYRRMTKGIQDGFKASGRGTGISYAGRLPGLRIDYVFTSPSIQVRSNFVGNQTYSDHFPVVAQISLPK